MDRYQKIRYRNQYQKETKLNREIIEKFWIIYNTIHMYTVSQHMKTCVFMKYRNHLAQTKKGGEDDYRRLSKIIKSGCDLTSCHKAVLSSLVNTARQAGTYPQTFARTSPSN